MPQRIPASQISGTYQDDSERNEDGGEYDNALEHGGTTAKVEVARIYQMAEYN